GEQVDAHVVVLPVRPGVVQWCSDALAAVAGGHLAEQLAAPLARLLQEVVPRDATVVLVREELEPDVLVHGSMDVDDASLVEGDTGEQREEALGGRSDLVDV